MRFIIGTKVERLSTNIMPLTKDNMRCVSAKKPTFKGD